ncbi:DUF4224 domain-containing protein [Methylomonas sp. ZR1]|uniref:DUF4224 domain-containing protein n=1 Tax=Methylomonas sp. ZR1 TaxID=1797072 RepID=UPI001492797F|nr:DUF4224 domain-containing protein [Methylomonas sp. ZR1]NOV28962.1 DUF4224 domain-containing protein [Methylomonas sp. ZR1]
MTTSLIQEEELMEWSGFKRRTALVNWLRQCGIPYLLGNHGRVCVTAESVNLPLLHIQRVLADSSDDIF